MLPETFVIKVSVWEFRLHLKSLLYVLFILFRPVNACCRHSAGFPSHVLLSVPALLHGHKRVFATPEPVYVRSRAAHTNSRSFFVSSVNKNAICQPHITAVLNHRSHLAPRPLCTLCISKLPTYSIGPVQSISICQV